MLIRGKVLKEEINELLDDDKSFIVKYELKGEVGSVLEVVIEKIKLKCKLIKCWCIVLGMKKWCL